MSGPYTEGWPKATTDVLPALDPRYVSHERMMVVPLSDAERLREETRDRLRYIETMLRGDTDRIQIADYISDHLVPALNPERGK